MELGSQNHSRDSLLGPNSIMVVYMGPLGYICAGRELRKSAPMLGSPPWAEDVELISPQGPKYKYLYKGTFQGAFKGPF